MAAREFIAIMTNLDIDCTPDGARYTIAAVAAAMADY